MILFKPEHAKPILSAGKTQTRGGGTSTEIQIAVVGVERDRLRIRKRLWSLKGGRVDKCISEDVREFSARDVADALWPEVTDAPLQA